MSSVPLLPTRSCARCKVEKPSDQFYFVSKVRNQRGRICLVCKSHIRAAWRKNYTPPPTPRKEAHERKLRYRPLKTRPETSQHDSTSQSNRIEIVVSYARLCRLASIPLNDLPVFLDNLVEDGKLLAWIHDEAKDVIHIEVLSAVEMQLFAGLNEIDPIISRTPPPPSRNLQNAR